MARRDRITDGMGGRIATGGSLSALTAGQAYRAVKPYLAAAFGSRTARPAVGRAAACGDDRDGGDRTARARSRPLAEIEDHVHAAGWDRGPALFALVRTAQFAADDPDDRGPPRASTRHGDA